MEMSFKNLKEPVLPKNFAENTQTKAQNSFVSALKTVTVHIRCAHS